MKMTRGAIAAILLVGTFVSAPEVVVTAAAPFEDNQVPIENRTSNGSLHIFSDDSLEEEVVDPPSVLSATGSGSSFCTSADSGTCADQTSLSFIAHLPVCSASVTTDCITSVVAEQTGGSQVSGSLQKYFPASGPHSFTGKPSIKLPTGIAPGIWRIPGAPHVGGDEYAVVARLRGSTARRSAASFQVVLTPVSLKSDADPSLSYEMAKWTEFGRMAGPAADRGSFRCAYWGENGSCMLSRSFPENTRFTVVVRLAVEPAGWLHGRINDPAITFTKEGTDTVVRISALPVQVPSFQVGKTYSDFPADVQKAFAVDSPYGAGGSRQPGGQYKTNPAERNAEYNIRSWKDESFAQLALMKDTISDKAGWAPSLWRVRTLNDGEMTGAGSCLTSGDGVKGIVTTNATVYGSGPPDFNSATSTLDYKVAAPHYTRTGDVFSGTYNLIMRSDVARCFYKFTSDPITASINVVKEDGTAGNATTTVEEKDGWVRFTATGFSHSAPTIRVKLSQSSRTTRTPSVATRVKKTVTGATLARAAGVNIPKGAKVSVSVSSRYARFCKVSGTSVRALSRGTCPVNVTVVTAAKKRTTKTVNIAVS